MQVFEYFREIEDIQNTSDIDKNYIYMTFAHWKTKLVSFETDSALL